MPFLHSNKQTSVTGNNLILLFAIFFSLLASCSSNGPKFNIIFSANLDGNQDLYQAIGPDFSSIGRLTFTPHDRESSLYLSRDSKKLVFVSNSKSDSPTILDLESKSLTKVEQGLFAWPVGWTPDGKNVILQKQSDTELELFIATLDGKIARALPIPYMFKSSFFDEVGFSPDGKLMAYMDEHVMGPPPATLNSPILYDFEMNQIISNLDSSAEVCSFLSWSPTEWKILVTCNLDFTDTKPDWHTYLFDIPQSTPEKFKKIADIKYCNYTLWSPTGERFIAACQVDDVWKWNIFDKNGTYEKELFSGENKNAPIHARIFAWSPDGKQIIYTAGPDNNSKQIYAVNADGSDNHLLIEKPSNYDWILTYPVVP